MLNHSHSNLPLIQDSDFLPPLGRWTMIGALVIVTAVGLAIPVAAVTKYKQTVKAKAVIRPAGELRVVQASSNGKVMRLMVSENQRVKTGDLIAVIDDSQLQTKKSQLENSIHQAQLQLVQINAQIEALNRQIAAETASNQGAVAAAVAQLGGNRRDYHDKQITANADLREAQAEVKATKALLQVSKSKHNRYQRVAKEGALSVDQVEEAQLAVEQQQQALAAAKAKVARAIALTNPSNANVTSAQKQIVQQVATGKANIAALEKDVAQLTQQRIELQKQQQLDQRDLQQVQVDLSRMQITATIDGIISQLKLRNSGQTVAAGEQIAQIVPSHVPVVVKAMVTPGDKSKLKPGQDVLMRVSACPYPDYGTLPGKVSAISADAIAPPPTNSNSSNSTPTAIASFYEVTIQPQTLSVGHGKRQCAIQLGMEGTADIISKQESVLQFFLRKARLIADI